MHQAVRENILSYFATAEKEELLKLSDDYINLALILCLEKLKELENLVFLSAGEGKPG